MKTKLFLNGEDEMYNSLLEKLQKARFSISLFQNLQTPSMTKKPIHAFIQTRFHHMILYLTNLHKDDYSSIDFVKIL